jgi:tetratricopeptide (TPR) repeat protein
MIYTFYSYKGGVGRSMALANVALWMRLQGLRVAMVDWDLEAPGLESFFLAPGQLLEMRSQVGVIDTLVSYTKVFPRFREHLAGAGRQEQDPTAALNAKVAVLADLLPPLSALNPIPVSGTAAQNGDLLLMTAGLRIEGNFAAYAHAVQAFDWNEFYAAYEGQAYFEWMRRQLLNRADVVLIDSRTGVTEMSGVCTRQLADVVVSFCAPNQQNLEGLISMAGSFSRPDLVEQRGRAIQTVMVPTRIDNFNPTRINEFARVFSEKTAPYLPQVFASLKTEFWALRIPYTPAYAYQERRAVDDPDSDKDLEESYKRLAAYLALLAPPQSAIRRAMAGEIDRVVGPRLPSVFVLSASEDCALGRSLRERIQSGNLGVWPEPAEVGHSATERQSAVFGILQQTKSLVILASAPTFRSALVQETWRQARQLGVSVVLVRNSECAQDSAALEDVPGWMLAQRPFDAETEWEQVIAVLSSPKTAFPIPLMAPSPPAGFLCRAELRTQVRKLLCEADTGRDVALFGPPGAGKTVVAAAIASDPQTETVFADGVLWAQAHDRESVEEELRKMYVAVAAKSGEGLSVSQLQAHLRSWLRGKRCLMVLDDVADAAIARELCYGVTGCRYLLTTHDRAIALDLQALPVEVGPLCPEDAESFMQRTTGAGPWTAELRPIIDAVGALPLALRLVQSGWVEQQLPVRHGMPGGRGADIEQLGKLVTTQLATRFEKEVLSRLSPEETDRLADLAFAADDAPTDPPSLARRWTAQPESASSTLTRLMDLGLYTRTDDERSTGRVYPWVRRLLAVARPDCDVNQTLELALGKVPSDQQETARQTLLRVVRICDDGKVEPRPTLFTELSPKQATLAPTLQEVGLLSRKHDPSGQDYLQLSRESAPRRWVRLRDWIEADREFITWRQRVGAYMQDWQRTKDTGALLSGGILAEALRWLHSRGEELSEAECAYINLSEREQAVPPGAAVSPPFNTRRNVLVVAGCATLFVALALLGPWAMRKEPTHSTMPPINASNLVTPLALTNDPRLVSPSAPGNLGDAAMQQGDFSSAVREYTKALSGQTNDANLYYKRGLAYMQNQEPDKALADFKASLSLSPDQPDVLAARANALSAGGKVGEAIADLNRVIELRPGNSAAYFQRGQLQARNRATKLAIEDYSKAIQLSPSNSEPYFARAVAYEEEGRTNEAVADIQKVIQLATEPQLVRAAQVRLNRFEGAQHPAGSRPTILIRFSDEADRRVADLLAKGLVGRGLTVAGVESFTASRNSSYGRVIFYAQDRGAAFSVKDWVERALADEGYSVQLELQPRGVQEGSPSKSGPIEVVLPPVTRNPWGNSTPESKQTPLQSR